MIFSFDTKLVFIALKLVFIEVPILIDFKLNGNVLIKINVSKYAIWDFSR